MIPSRTTLVESVTGHRVSINMRNITDEIKDIIQHCGLYTTFLIILFCDEGNSMGFEEI